MNCAMLSALRKRAEIPGNKAVFMEESVRMDAHVQVRKIYQLLSEVQTLSMQLAEAIDRNDEVAIQMVLAMREEPLRALQRVQNSLRRQLEAMEPADAKALRSLLNGEPAGVPEEEPIAQQVAANARLLQRVRELDSVLNRKITHEQSIYS